MIAKSGCGYAAATNYVFKYFEGKEEEFLKKYNINISIIYHNNVNSYKPNDVISGDDFSLYKIGITEKGYDNLSVYNSVNSHYVYVVDVDNNEIIVSSWGNKFIYKDNDLIKDEKILIRVNK